MLYIVHFEVVMADLFSIDESDEELQSNHRSNSSGIESTDDLVLQIPLLTSLEQDDSMGAATQKSMMKKLAKEGYIEGKREQEGKEMQRGFDEGFERGQKLGRLCGRVYGDIRAAYSKALLRAVNNDEIYDGSKSCDDRIEELKATLISLEKLFFFDFPRCMQSRSLEMDAGECLFSTHGEMLESKLIHIISKNSIDLFMQDLRAIK